MNESVTISIRSAFDAIIARAKVREFARETGLDVTGQARISLAAYSLANTTKLRSISQCQLSIQVLQKGKRAGIFISVEGSTRQDFFDNARSIVKNLFATIDVEYKEELFCAGIDEKESILRHPDYLEKAFELGEKIASANL